MKRLNKVLALVLAMTMMFGVVSVCASAADTVNAAYRVEFVDNDGNAITEVKAGSTANVIVSIKTNGYSPVFAFLAIYDSTSLTHIRKNGTEVQSLKPTNCAEVLGRFANTSTVENPSQDLIDHEDDEIGDGTIYDWGYSEPTITPHTDAMYPADFTDAQKAQYKCINFGYLSNSGKTSLTVNTAGEFVRMVRFRFLANVDTELNNNVFYFNADDTKTYITIDPDDEPFANLQSSKAVSVSNLTFEYAGGSATPSYTVNTLDAQVQWADKEAGLMNLGFRGQFVGFDVEADKGTTVGPNGGTNLKEDTQLKEVGIILTKGTGSGTKYPVHTVYNFKDGGYFYRLVVGNVSYTGTEEFSAKAYVVIGSKTFEASNTITTTGAAQYNRAKDQMGAK